MLKIPECIKAFVRDKLSDSSLAISSKNCSQNIQCIIVHNVWMDLASFIYFFTMFAIR